MGLEKLRDSIIEQGRQDPARLEPFALGSGPFSGDEEIESIYNNFVMSGLPSFVTQAQQSPPKLTIPQAPQGLMPVSGTDFNELAGLLAGPIPDFSFQPPSQLPNQFNQQFPRNAGMPPLAPTLLPAAPIFNQREFIQGPTADPTMAEIIGRRGLL